MQTDSKQTDTHHLATGPRLISTFFKAVSCAIRSSSIRKRSTRSRVSSVWYGVEVSIVDPPEHSVYQIYNNRALSYHEHPFRFEPILMDGEVSLVGVFEMNGRRTL